MTNTISNTDDIIDSRDVIARIEELQGEREALESELESAQETLDDMLDDTSVLSGDEAKDQQEIVAAAIDALAEWDDEYATELQTLTALQDEAEWYCSDWQDGAALIRESYFTEHAIEMLKDIGCLPAKIPHYVVIDEEATAENIKADYTSVEFDGATYWVRWV